MSEQFGALEEQWYEDPSATAANLVDAVVTSRVQQVLQEHVAPQLAQAQQDRWRRNTDEAWNAVRAKYAGAKSVGGFDVSEYGPQLDAYLAERPHEFPDALVENPQRLAEKLEQVVLGERARWQQAQQAREFAAIKAASSEPYQDAMARADAGLPA